MSLDLEGMMPGDIVKKVRLGKMTIDPSFYT